MCSRRVPILYRHLSIANLPFGRKNEWLAQNRYSFRLLLGLQLSDPIMNFCSYSVFSKVKNAATLRISPDDNILHAFASRTLPAVVTPRQQNRGENYFCFAVISTKHKIPTDGIVSLHRLMATNLFFAGGKKPAKTNLSNGPPHSLRPERRRKPSVICRLSSGDDDRTEPIYTAPQLYQVHVAENLRRTCSALVAEQTRHHSRPTSEDTLATNKSHGNEWRASNSAICVCVGLPMPKNLEMRRKTATHGEPQTAKK